MLPLTLATQKMVGPERIELSFLGLKDRCFAVKLRAEKLELRIGVKPMRPPYRGGMLSLHHRSRYIFSFLPTIAFIKATISRC